MDTEFYEVFAKGDRFEIRKPSRPYAWGGYSFKDRQRAETAAERMNTLELAGKDRIPPALTREQYELFCTALEAPVMTDSEITQARYAIDYGDFDVFNYDVATILKWSLARSRNRAMRGGQTPATVAPRRIVRLVRCDCGHEVPAELVMSASLGSTCPDCYDKWSD